MAFRLTLVLLSVCFVAAAPAFSQPVQSSSYIGPALPPLTEAEGGYRKVAIPPRNYVLTPGDIVQIEVFQEPEMTNQQRISQDGSIVVSLIGKIKVGGRTVDDASRAITEALKKDYFVDPQVSLGIVEYAAKRYTVLGHVGSPGSYDLPNEQPLTLIEALARAGGNRSSGDLRRVTIARKVGDRIQVIRVNASDVRSSGVTVQEGDTITVPETPYAQRR